MTDRPDLRAASRALLDLNRAAPRAARSFPAPTPGRAAGGSLSQEQEKALASQSHRLVVTALAGTGKSRLLGEFVRRSPQQKWHYLAFNKSMATEAAQTMPGAICKTVHSLAYAAFGRPYESQLGTQVPFETVLRECGAPLHGGKTLAVAIITTAQRFVASSDAHVDSRHVPMSAWAKVRENESLSVDLNQVVQFAATWWGSMVQHQGLAPMDLDGLVKLMQLSGHAPRAAKNAAFLVDEAQDLTMCVRGWLDRLPYRTIRAGDPFQSIYGWRMMGMAPEWVSANEEEHWLTGSWRFGPEVAELVNPLLCHMGAGHGLVGLAGPTEISTRVLGDEAILSRTRSTLRSAVALCGKEGKKVDPGWSPWLKEEDSEDLLASNHTFPAETARSLFQAGGILAMTAHASKGGSFDAVRLLEDFSWPPANESVDQMEEARILYVALTRARKRLVLEDRLLSSLRDFNAKKKNEVSDDGF